MRMIKTKLSSDNFFYFSRFVIVFTLIFLTMTAIILQVMKSGVYSSVDTELIEASQNINELIDFRMSYGDDKRPPIKPDSVSESGKTYRKLSPNSTLLLFNTKGELLNTVDYSSGLEDYELNKFVLDKPISEPVDYWGDKEIYRQITVRVSNLTFPTISYAVVLINIRELEDVHGRFVRIIVALMSLFWFLSVIASVYLAKWARKPILESYERQKNFVENASHELRTPLAVLQNRLEGLFRHPDESILDNSESIAASLEEVRNMKRLTTNLLNLARRDEGFEPNLEELDWSFFDELFDNYQLIATENGKQFKEENRVNHPFYSDRTLLKQLLTILFDNAVKYTEDNGSIKIAVYQKEKKLYIEVCDDGSGIPDKDKSKIFDRFYRVDKVRNRQKGGFGLGLSLAKQIVTSLNGKMILEDNQPQGSVFKLIF